MCYYMWLAIISIRLLNKLIKGQSKSAGLKYECRVNKKGYEDVPHNVENNI